MIDEIENKLAQLEEKFYFQEQYIKELNEALVLQQKQMDSMEKIMLSTVQRLQQLNETIGDDGGELTVPPHY